MPTSELKGDLLTAVPVIVAQDALTVTLIVVAILLAALIPWFVVTRKA